MAAMSKKIPVKLTIGRNDRNCFAAAAFRLPPQQNAGTRRKKKMGYLGLKWEFVEDELPQQDDYEIAYLSKKTGKMAIEVRRAMMKVGADRQKVEAELKKLEI
jgi:hypothetical protein